MSLDFYLNGKDLSTTTCECDRCGNKHENSYYALLHHLNITHNLVPMAMKCGIYEYIWRPKENDINEACQLLKPLETALEVLLYYPSEFKSLNPENGWGSYDNLVRSLESLLDACKEHPSATIEVYR